MNEGLPQKPVRWMAVAVIGALAWSGLASAGPIPINLPGNTDFDAWDNLTVSNPQVADTNEAAGGQSEPGAFGGFPGAAPWPAPIESVLTFGTTDRADDDPTGDATFGKLLGNGYPALSSIYGGASFGPPGAPYPSATHQIEDKSPVAGLETIVFQITVGSGSAGWLDGTPLLGLDGSTPSLTPSREQLLFSEFDPAGPFGPLTLNTYLYQWDVSGVPGAIGEFDINFTMDGSSTTIWELQLDQGSQFVVVPEPATAALLGVGALALVLRRQEWLIA